MKSIADVGCGSIGHEIRDSGSGGQGEVELAGLFRNLSGQVSPEGASSEFGIRSYPV